MLIYVKPILLENESTGILKRLLKYPPVGDIYQIIGMALAFKDDIFNARCLNDHKIRHRHDPPHQKYTNFENDVIEEAKSETPYASELTKQAQNFEPIQRNPKDNDMVNNVNDVIRLIQEQLCV